MEKEYPYTGFDGQNPRSSKRPWDMVDNGQPDLVGQWQGQGKRLCVPDSFGDANLQMEMTSDAPPLLSNEASGLPDFVESSLSFLGLPETPYLPWSNDSSEVSPMNLQLSPEMWRDRFLQPASYSPPSSDAINSSNELLTFKGSPKTLEQFTGSLETGSIAYSRISMSDDLVHYHEDPQTSLAHLNLIKTDFLGLTNASGPCNQNNNDMTLMHVKLPNVVPLNFPTGIGSWNLPNQLNTQIPQPQLCPTGVDSSEPFDLPQAAVLNEDIPLNSNLLHDATTRMDDCSTESETLRSLLLQLQKQDSLGRNSIASSISDNSSQTLYECNQNGVSENATTILIEDPKNVSPAESLLLSQFERSTLEKGITEDCPSFQSQGARSRETPHNALSEQNEEINEVGYDTCFGMIRTGPVKLQGRCLGTKLGVDQGMTLKIYDDIVMIYHTQTMRYEGLLDHNTGQALAALSRNYSTTFKASLDEKPSTLKKSTSNNSRSLQITLYGLRRDSDTIGTLLSENKLYLQQPSTFDSSVIYFNPQYLLRPGSELKLAVQENFQCSVREKQMSQAVRSQMLRVFDVAVGPATFSEVQVSKRLTAELKSYQRKALAMMVEKESGMIENPEFPPLWVPKTVRGGLKRYWNPVTGHNQHHPPRLCLGGLLADEMGLGKTLTMLALIARSIDHFDNLYGVDVHSLESSSNVHASNATLIITPLSTLSTWEEQIGKHLEPGSIKYLLYHGAERELDISNLLKNDLVITTYDILKAECPINSKRKSHRSGLLHSIDWFRVVLDEAHIIRNRSSQVFNSVDTLQARHRWCLTGTPIQNRVEDFGALVSFLQVYPFDSHVQFQTNFVSSIQRGENIGIERLKALIQAISLRRTKQSVFGELRLGARVERVQSVELSKEERTLYTIVKRSWTSAVSSPGSIRSIFQTITKLRQICDHGRELLSPETLAFLDQGRIDGLRLESISRESESCENCGAVVQDPDSDEIADYFLSCEHLLCNQCLPKNPASNTEGALCPLCSLSGTPDLFWGDEQATHTFPDPYQDAMNIDLSYRPSSKVLALLKNLRVDRLESAKDPIKSVVFTSWTRMLDLIEKALAAERIMFQRIDGGKSLRHRRQAIQSFRDNPLCTVLLASIGSAGVGLDLTAASRVHLLEPQWNPMAEEQALDRVHRLGQTREVMAIRYIVKDSVEEYIMQTQRAKLNLIQASFGDGSLSRVDIIKERLKILQGVLK